MDLRQLQQSLKNPKRPPIERWNPPFCGPIPLEIAANGEWLYQGSPITREALVKLFASVLCYQNNEYFLVTPAEKVQIQVADLPFLITAWQHEISAQQPVLLVTTNLGERFYVGSEHPLVQVGGLPAIQVRDGLLARVHRNVYYQWAELAEPAQGNEAPGYYLPSAGQRFLFAR